MKISEAVHSLVFGVFEFKDHVEEECQRIIEVRDALASGERVRAYNALHDFYYNASIMIDSTLVMSTARRIRRRTSNFNEDSVVPIEVVEEVLGTMYEPLVHDIKMIADYNVEQGLCCDRINDVVDLEHLLYGYLTSEEKVPPKRAKKHIEVFMGIKEACIDYRGIIALLTDAVFNRDAALTKELLDRSVSSMKIIKHRCVVYDTYYSMDWWHED